MQRRTSNSLQAYSGKVFSNCESTGWGMDSEGLRFSSTGELGSLFLSYVRDKVKDIFSIFFNSGQC